MSDLAIIYTVIHDILCETYGGGTMVDTLCGSLTDTIAENINEWSREVFTREIANILWNWFSGGDTAYLAANKMIEALIGEGVYI